MAVGLARPQGEVTLIADKHETEHKSFGSPDETREFPNGRAEILNLGGGEVGRFVFEPGWRWSNDVKPIAQTDSCERRTSSTTSAAGWPSTWTTGQR
jgi:hypothetical protein